MHRSILATVFLILLLNMPQQAFSQKEPDSPAVLEIFQKYGSAKGVTLLEISKDLMKDYNISLFKSIIFENGYRFLPEIIEAIEKDKKDAKLIKESKKDGLLNSGYYRLESIYKKNNRYLIFKIGSKNKVTLIYIEGELTSEQLIDLLK